MPLPQNLRSGGKTLIAVLHLPPLPGAPRADGDLEAALEFVLREAAVYADAGIDTVIVENHGDAPFPSETSEPHVAAMIGVIARAVREATGMTVGINVLRNDARAALAAAAAGGGEFVRVNVLTGVTATDQGLIEGRADEVMRYRARVAPEVAVLADIEVKFGTALYAPSLEVLARSTLDRALADGLIVSGVATGAATSTEKLWRVRDAVGDALVLAGSGVTAESVNEVLRHADGAIVGSTFKEGGEVERPVEPARVARFMEAWTAAV